LGVKQFLTIYLRAKADYLESKSRNWSDIKLFFLEIIDLIIENKIVSFNQLIIFTFRENISSDLSLNSHLELKNFYFKLSIRKLLK
jgi:hypothetical protein